VSEKFIILSSCFNKNKYLREFFQSIIKQTYRPIEIVIANDCSDDGSYETLLQLEKEAKNHDIEFKLVNNSKKLCCGSSYSNLMKYATGSFYGVVDSDDMLVPDAVRYVVDLYRQYPQVSWIYTQFQTCDRHMQPIQKGISRHPPEGMSILDLGEKRKHSYSHWRTFSNKINNPSELFCQNLKCAVDKYMGYKLEELGTGLFVDRVCYLYRQGVKRSVAASEKTKDTWLKITQEAVQRRIKNNIKAFPILEYQEPNGKN